jgi:1-acyl-sn-glycerol-3-phosphate acyltransferase
MAILIQIKAILLCIFLLFFALLPACLLAAPFSLTRRLKIVCPVWSLCSRLLLRYGCHAHLDIQEDLRAEAFRGTPPYGLYVCNHQSFVDIPFLMTMYQAPTIMKKEVLYIPILGWLAWFSGAMPVSRSKVTSRKKVLDQAKDRMTKNKIGLLVYPEGTRSKDALPKHYDKIKRTLLVFAFNEKIPVIPTSIYGTRGVLSSKGLIQPGRHLGIIVHKEILPQSYKNSDEFCRAIWGKVIEGHDDIKSRLAPLNETLS